MDKIATPLAELTEDILLVLKEYRGRENYELRIYLCIYDDDNDTTETHLLENINIGVLTSTEHCVKVAKGVADTMAAKRFDTSGVNGYVTIYGDVVENTTIEANIIIASDVDNEVFSWEIEEV